MTQAQEGNGTPNAAHAGPDTGTRRRTLDSILMYATCRTRSEWAFVKGQEIEKPLLVRGLSCRNEVLSGVELWPTAHGDGVIPDERIVVVPVFRPDDYRTRFATHEGESVANTYWVPGIIRGQAGVAGNR